MELLAAGVIAWSLTHLFPSIVPDAHDRLVARLGKHPYRGLFSLIIIGSLALIVTGWRSAPATLFYTPPFSSGPITSLLVLVGFILFFASQVPGNIKRFIRHPQMTGTFLWAAAHLLSNGESRSLVLFGGFALWAAVEVWTINRRDGKWVRPQPAALKFDMAAVILGTTAFAAVFYFHATLFGVAVMRD